MNIPGVTKVCLLQQRHWWTQRLRLNCSADSAFGNAD